MQVQRAAAEYVNYFLRPKEEPIGKLSPSISIKSPVHNLSHENFHVNEILLSYEMMDIKTGFVKEP